MLRNDKTTQKLKIGQKRQKLLKPFENNLESFHDQTAKQFFFSKHFISNLYKTPKTTSNLLKIEQFSKTAAKLKVGEERRKLSNH